MLYTTILYYIIFYRAYQRKHVKEKYAEHESLIFWPPDSSTCGAGNTTAPPSTAYIV